MDRTAPEVHSSLPTREAIARLIKDRGYEVQLTDGKAALLPLPNRGGLQSAS